MKTLFLLLILSVPAFAQKSVEPIRLNISSEADADERGQREFHKLLRSELQARGDIVISSRRFDYRLYVGATAITARGKVTGYAAAVFIQRERAKWFYLGVQTAPTLEDAARAVAATLDKEAFK